MVPKGDLEMLAAMGGGMRRRVREAPTMRNIRRCGVWGGGGLIGR
jgi:hypothetical protein